MKTPYRRNDFVLSPHFRLYEFEDPTTGEVILDPGLVFRLEVLRHSHGASITISSGYRTPEHNMQVGGVPQSKHLTGKAVDIPGHPEKVRSLSVSAVKAGFRDDQIVIEVDHLHLEVD
jgi:zinc D-Ala-D-Ala carboxypeptidase